MKLFVIPGLPNVNAEKVITTLTEVVKILTDHGAEVYVDSESKEYIDSSMKTAPKANSGYDALIAVGGDGTILSAAKAAVEWEVPLLGINAGSLGFLSGLERKELSELHRLVNGDFIIKERMLISTEIMIDDEKKVSAEALNEILITKSDFTKAVEFEVWCGEKIVCIYRGDGLIFATPTGSTAYSMSAGGPVTDTELNAVIMTPVCPHALFTRPMVFSPDKSFTVIARRTNNSSKLYVSADGRILGELGLEKKLSISRSNKTLKIIELRKRDFYEVFEEKFRSNI
ncbi:MAG: NAD(+)/NADH kinase [Oscillospiraceae bacterium]|nr:NAD(+)/NADH kinase [Oscillospiraceae bacterium]